MSEMYHIVARTNNGAVFFNSPNEVTENPALASEWSQSLVTKAAQWADMYFPEYQWQIAPVEEINPHNSGLWHLIMSLLSLVGLVFVLALLVSLVL